MCCDRRCPVLLLLTVLSLLLVAGCGREQTAVPEGSEHVVLRERLRGIDPLQAVGRASGVAAVSSNIYEPLFDYHYLKRPYEVIPCLAAQMPEWSADRLMCRIRLHADARFQDDACFPGGKGRAVTAQDVIFSWERIATPSNASAFWALLEHRIIGLDDHRQALRLGGTKVDVAGLRAVDAHTLEIRLTRPWPQLPHVLAHPAMAVVPMEAVNHYGADFPRHPVGTGPFRLRAWDPAVGVVLEKSPSFRAEHYPADGEEGDAAGGLLVDAGRRLPLVNELHFHVIQASEPAWLLFLQGRLDHLGVPSDHFSDVLDTNWQLQGAWREKGLKVDVFSAMFLRWIGFNMANPVVGRNLALRRAISLAMDRQEFNDLFLSGRCGLPNSLLPPGMKEHRPGMRDPWMTFNLEAARAQRAAAERLHGSPLPPLTLRMGGSSPLTRQIGQLFSRWLAEAGLELRVDYVEEGSLASSMKERPASLFFGDGYNMVHPDPTDLFRRFQSRTGDGEPNAFHYQNAAFDEMHARLESMPDSPERVRLAQEMEDLLLKDLPCVVFLSYNWVSVRHEWLANFKPHAFSSPNGVAKYHRVDSALRQRALKGGMP